MSSKIGESLYSVDLRRDQWDLIILCLQHVRGMSLGGDSAYAVDNVGRKFLRRCVDETVLDIQANVPGEK